MLGVGSLGLYLSTLTADHTHDAVVFALFSERAVGSGQLFLELFHPHHVLYNALGAAILWLATVVGLPLGGLGLLQLLSAAAGAALVVVTFLTLERLTRSAWIAAGTASVLAVAAGIWAYATMAECNLLALAFAVAALCPAIAGVEGGSRRGLAAAALLLGLAAAFHLTLGTLWIALVAVAAARGRATLARAVAMLTGASSVLALAYVPRALLLWQAGAGAGPLDLIVFTGQSPEGGYLFQAGFQPLGELGLTLRGVAHGGEGAACTALAWGLRTVPVAWLTAGVVAALRRRGGAALAVGGVWLGTNLLLFACWSHLNFEFTSFEVVPLAIVGGLALAALAPRTQRLLGVALLVAAAALAAANGRCFIAPGLDPGDNPHLEAAEVIRSTLAENDLLVVSGLPPDRRLKVYALYFGGRRAIIPEFVHRPGEPPERFLRRVDRALRDACRRGARVHVVGDLVEAREVAAPYPLEPLRAYLGSLRPEPVARTSDGFTLYRLQECPLPE